MSTVYEIYADKIKAIIEHAEKNPEQWKNPFRMLRPANGNSGRQYHNGNELYLTLYTMMEGYEEPYYMTYRQAAEMGGQVRAGEHGTIVLYAAQNISASTRKEKYGGRTMDKIDPDEISNGDCYFFMRYSTVFNICQIDGISREKVKIPPAKVAELASPDIIDAYPNAPKIKRQQYSSGAYSPDADEIIIPITAADDTDRDRVTKTLYHEMVHSTGHASRLNRPGITEDRTPARYAMEELIAETGAIMLCDMSGIPATQAGEYLKNWKAILDANEPDAAGRAILHAVKEAAKAVEYITGKKTTQEAAA
jgi:antirestriction protein ArdC